MGIKSFTILIVALTVMLYGNNLSPEKILVYSEALNQQRADSLAPSELKIPTMTYKLIPGINKTWGYDVLMDNRIKIHQPSIPGLPGNEGFKTKEKAEKVAKLVIQKMKTGEMPPTITNEELKELKVI